MRRRRWVAVVVVGTVVLVLGTTGVPSQAAPSPGPSPQVTSTAPVASDAPSPCASSDCIPQPSTSSNAGLTPQPTSTSQDDDGNGGPGGIAGWIAKGITSALNSFFRGIVDAALNPLLDLLGKTLLTTPNPSSLPRIGELWANSWQIVLACYALLISMAGILVMAYETVQTRYSIKEIAPRVPLGFLAAGLSLFLAGKAIDLANALSQAVMGEGVDANTAGATMRALVFEGLNSSGGSVFFVLIGLIIAGSLVALLVCYVVRLALTAILIAGAPLALMCYALPQTDGIARWWWKAFGGVLAIQIAQSLALIVSLRLFLAPGGFNIFGPTPSGLVNLIVALALFYILLKIPFWILGSLRFSHGRSFVGGLARAFIAYKTFGMLRGAGGRVSGVAAAGGRRHRPPPGSAGVPANSPMPSGPSPASRSRDSGASRSSSTQPARTGSGTMRPAPGPPLFLPPTSASPGPATGQASGPPPLPEFRGPGDPPGGRGDPPVRPRPKPTGPIGAPTFRAPTIRPAQPSVASGRQAGAPGNRASQDPGPQPQPGRGNRSPTAPAFRPPVARAATPLPTTFNPPPPAHRPPQMRAPAPPRNGGPRRSGGDQR
ncbi:hypothetical protein ACFVYG_25930 [Streptomyces sp. NPDC058256]|uniref:hypothetical protein n=1 Tax=Streptomyces sp. NPDC058256 TaxID=3346408 RepID=UPI0036F07739